MSLKVPETVWPPNTPRSPPVPDKPPNTRFPMGIPGGPYTSSTWHEWRVLVARKVVTYDQPAETVRQTVPPAEWVPLYVAPGGACSGGHAGGGGGGGSGMATERMFDHCTSREEQLGEAAGQPPTRTYQVPELSGSGEVNDVWVGERIPGTN